MPLWSGAAPGSEQATGDEVVQNIDHVSNIHRPSLTVFLPTKEKNTGVAVIIAPGGGHQFLWINYEGYALARWLADRGVAAFVLKYRLAKDSSAPGGKSPYTVEDHALADARRAIRLVRSRASEWAINPRAVGMLGFSAGGELALLASAWAAPTAEKAADPIEQQNARPDFCALIYPGGLERPDVKVTPTLPPFFLLCGAQDRESISVGVAEFYLRCKQAGVSAELHVYSGARHGFGVKNLETAPAHEWPQRLVEWLIEQKLIQPAS